MDYSPKRVCKTCGVLKPLQDFSKTNRGEFSSTCKKCTADKQRKWYEDNKETISLKRSVNNLTRALNTLSNKADNAGFKLSVINIDGFKLSLEEK